MKVLIFGATGMVGQGVLRECLLDSQVEKVISISRSSCGVQNPKLEEKLQSEPTQLEPLKSELTQIDACFFCLGVSSAGMSEEQYRKITYDLTLQAAQTLAEANPQMTFVYVSGENTDSTEKGSTMWARVKGKTENDLLKLPFKAYMFRPGFIQPMNGESPKSTFYKMFYVAFKPFFALIPKIFPNQSTSTVKVGRAMLAVAKSGNDKKILLTKDINAVAERSFAKS